MEKMEREKEGREVVKPENDADSGLLAKGQEKRVDKRPEMIDKNEETNMDEKSNEKQSKCERADRETSPMKTGCSHFNGSARSIAQAEPPKTQIIETKDKSTEISILPEVPLSKSVHHISLQTNLQEIAAKDGKESKVGDGEGKRPEVQDQRAVSRDERRDRLELLPEDGRSLITDGGENRGEGRLRRTDEKEAGKAPDGPINTPREEFQVGRVATGPEMQYTGGAADDSKFAGLANLLVDFHRSHKERHQASAKTIADLENVIAELKSSPAVQSTQIQKSIHDDFNEKLDLFAVIKQENLDFLHNERLKRDLLANMSDFLAQNRSEASQERSGQKSQFSDPPRPPLKYFILNLEDAAADDPEIEGIIQRAIDLDSASAYVEDMCYSDRQTPAERDFTFQGSMRKTPSPALTRIESADAVQGKFEDIQEAMIAYLSAVWAKVHGSDTKGAVDRDCRQVSRKIELAEKLSAKIEQIDSIIGELSPPYESDKVSYLIGQIEEMISYACAKSTETGLGTKDIMNERIGSKIRDIKMIKQSPLRTPAKRPTRSRTDFEPRRSTDLIMREAKVLFTQDSYPKESKDRSSRQISDSEQRVRATEREADLQESSAKHQRSLQKYKEIVKQYDDQLKRDTEYISKLKDDLKDCRVQLENKVEANRNLQEKVSELEKAIVSAQESEKDLGEIVDHGDIDKASEGLTGKQSASHKVADNSRDRRTILKLERGLLKVADYTSTLGQIANKDENSMSKIVSSLPRKLELLDKMINTLLCIIEERKEEGCFKSPGKTDPRALARADLMKKDLRELPQSQLPPVGQTRRSEERAALDHLEHMNTDRGDLTFKGGEKTLFSETKCKAFIESLPEVVKSVQDRLKRLLELRRANLLIDDRVRGYAPALKGRSNLQSKLSELDQFLDDSPLVSFHRRIGDLQERFTDFMDGYLKKLGLLSQSMKESTYPRKDYLERLAAAFR